MSDVAACLRCLPGTTDEKEDRQKAQGNYAANEKADDETVVRDT